MALPSKYSKALPLSPFLAAAAAAGNGKGGFNGSNNPNGSSSNNPEFLKAVDEIDRYMKQMESDNGPMGSKDVAELQLHYAKKMRQVSYKFILSFVYVVLNILYYGFNFFSYH